MNSRVTVRAATPRDLPDLYLRIERGDHERLDLSRAVVYVAEAEGRLVGFVAARLRWQVEPLLLFEGVRGARARRATLLLARAVEGYIRAQTGLGLGGFLCFIRYRRMWKLAEHFGLRRIYRRGRLYLREQL